MQEGLIFLIILVVATALSIMFKMDEEREEFREQLQDALEELNKLLLAKEGLEWYRDTAIKQLSKYPLVKLVVGTGIENVVVCKRLNGFASIEVGDIHYDAKNQGYLITHFIGIVENDVYFNSIPFKNDNSYLL